MVSGAASLSVKLTRDDHEDGRGARRGGDDGSQTTTTMTTTMIGHDSHASLCALAQVELRLPGRLDLGHAGVLRIEAVPDLLGTVAADLARRGAGSVQRAAWCMVRTRRESPSQKRTGQKRSTRQWVGTPTRPGTALGCGAATRHNSPAGGAHELNARLSISGKDRVNDVRLKRSSLYCWASSLNRRAQSAAHPLSEDPLSQSGCTAGAGTTY